MSWIDVFPFLSEDHLEDAGESMSEEQSSGYAGLFESSRVINRQPARPQILSISVGADPGADGFGKLAAALPSRHPDVTFRAFVASDAVPRGEMLAEMGWEVVQMRADSTIPGLVKIWRLLPLGERGKWITPINHRRLEMAEGNLERTRILSKSGLSIWRVPAEKGKDGLTYRPVDTDNFGVKGGLPVKAWIKSLIWHMEQGSFPETATLPTCGSFPIANTRWPNWNFADWLLMSVYPYLAKRGVMSFVPLDRCSPFLIMDLEYVSWLNSASECVFHKDAKSKCC